MRLSSSMRYLLATLTVLRKSADVRRDAAGAFTHVSRTQGRRVRLERGDSHPDTASAGPQFSEDVTPFTARADGLQRELTSNSSSSNRRSSSCCACCTPQARSAASSQDPLMARYRDRDDLIAPSTPCVRDPTRLGTRCTSMEIEASRAQVVLVSPTARHGKPYRDGGRPQRAGAKK